jgi:hypothetical protein
MKRELNENRGLSPISACINHLSTCMQSKSYAFRNPQMPGVPDQCDARCLYP